MRVKVPDAWQEAKCHPLWPLKRCTTVEGILRNFHRPVFILPLKPSCNMKLNLNTERFSFTPRMEHIFMGRLDTEIIDCDDSCH